jgi:hypothetical protein
MRGRRLGRGRVVLAVRIVPITAPESFASHAAGLTPQGRNAALRAAATRYRLSVWHRVPLAGWSGKRRAGRITASRSVRCHRVGPASIIRLLTSGEVHA